MEFETVQLSGDITHLILKGRLDMEGALAIDMKFSIATSVRREKIIADLDQVSFMSSIGIRLLITAAKAQASRGGKLVLASPQPMVRKVLETAGIDKLIPMVGDLDAGRACLAE